MHDISSLRQPSGSLLLASGSTASQALDQSEPRWRPAATAAPDAVRRLGCPPDRVNSRGAHVNLLPRHQLSLTPPAVSR
jgi:hypothetical protein